MRRDEVPQDHLRHYGEARKAMYAVDERGRYTTVASSGWEAEGTVTSDALAEYARLAEAARARVQAGTASPLEFHMYDRRMDEPSLAQGAGLWRWRLRRHLRPAVFARLPERLLRRYAEALGLSIEALKRLP